MQDLRALAPLPPDEFMAGFQRLQLAPVVDPPPPPPRVRFQRGWPGGRRVLRAVLDAFDQGDLDAGHAAGRLTGRPTSHSGARSNPDYFARMAERPAAIFSYLTIETFPGRHRFPSAPLAPVHLAKSLLTLWRRAEQ